MLRIFIRNRSCMNGIGNTGLIRHLHSDAAHYGTKPLSITSTRKWINLLSETERAILLSELQKSSHSHRNQDEDAPPLTGTSPGHDETTRRSLSRIIFLANTLPFIGFGFLDNAIMVIAGEYIDITFASAFGISTMAAAGLGNLISDMCGIGMVGYVERFAARCGVHLPENMTTEEMASSSVRWCTMLGRLTGITIGCLLGMLPLLFFPETPTDCEKAEKRHSRDTGT